MLTSDIMPRFPYAVVDEEMGVVSCEDCKYLGALTVGIPCPCKHCNWIGYT